jgi:hypothetical protein
VNKSKLSILLDTYQEQKGKGDSYKDVILELLNGDSLLLLPSANGGSENQESATDSESKTLKLSSVFNVDGIKVLGAFTDENALFSWAKQPVPYKMLESKDVLKLCEETAIGRIVINSGLPTMFVLEQNRG